jgi:hypothetical protein
MGRQGQHERARNQAVRDDGFYSHADPFGNAVWLKLT